MYTNKQGIKILTEALDLLTGENYIFSMADLSSLFPLMSRSALIQLLSRAVKTGVISKVCRGIFINPKTASTGLELYHAAAKFRPSFFNYISLETALSDEGIISQMPINRITIMTNGRKNEIFCGNYGTIEFIHTKKQLKDIRDRVRYDHRCGMWRADVGLALDDLKAVGRNLDLVDYGVLNDRI